MAAPPASRLQAGPGTRASGRGDGDSLATALECTRRQHRAGGYPGSAFLVRGYQLGWSPGSRDLLLEHQENHPR
jgi:hypothetical protein